MIKIWGMVLFDLFFLIISQREPSPLTPEMAFFAEHPKEFVIGYTAFRKGLTIKRGKVSGLSFPDHYENAEVFCCIRDSFNGLRDTGKIPILRKAF